MHKSEVQSLIPLSSRRLKIIRFLFRRKLRPLSFLTLVAPNVVLLHSDVQCDVEYGDRYQGAVSLFCGKFVSERVNISPGNMERGPTVIRNIILPIDVTANDALHLHKHVIKRSRHGPCASAVADTTAPANLNRVWRRIRQERGQNCVCGPWIRGRDRQ